MKEKLAENLTNKQICFQKLNENFMGKNCYLFDYIYLQKTKNYTKF